MPLALIAIGTILLISAVRGTTSDLFRLLKGDFTGEGNFLIWILAIAAVGSVGYVKPLRPISNAFLVLIVIIFLLAANKGGKDFFSSLFSQLTAQPISLGASTATSGKPEKDGFFEQFTDSSKSTTKTVTTIAKLFGF